MHRLAVRILVAAFAVTGLVSALPAQANLITNGSFEISPPSRSCVAGTTSVYGWTVGQGNVDIDSAISGCGGIPAADGTYWVDLTGSYNRGAGSISQAFATTIGDTYSLSFWFGGNPQWQSGAGCAPGYGNDSAIKSMNVGLNGSVVGTYSIDTTNQACNSAGWTYYSLLFSATSATTTLTFTSLNAAGVYGPLLDGVIVENVSVPEPSTVALFSLGLAGLGFARRRKLN